LLPCTFLVIPEVGSGHSVIDFCDASRLASQVKDSLEGERYASADHDSQSGTRDPWRYSFFFKKKQRQWMTEQPIIVHHCRQVSATLTDNTLGCATFKRVVD